MAIPTSAQLERINRFTQTDLTEENTYVFNNLMIDDQLVSGYYVKVHENLLRTFVRDVIQGVPLIIAHENNRLPVGRSFDAYLREDYENGELIKSVYGQYYIPLGINTEVGLVTDEIVAGIETGLYLDTSVGFNAEQWICSICGNDIRDYWSCTHYPGRKYVIARDGEDVIELCYVIVGENGKGELVEDSLVYAGASSRAGVRNFSVGSVIESKGGSKLRIIEDFKDIPITSTIYLFCGKNGSALFCDTEERTDGSKYLRRKEDEGMNLEKIKKVLSDSGITFENTEELNECLNSLKVKIEQGDLAVGELSRKVTGYESEIGELKHQIELKDASILELTSKVEEFTKDVEIAKVYREDLVNRALDLGVRVNGNAFNKDVYQKMFNTMSIDELKEVVAAFDAQVKDKFSGAAVAGQERKPVTSRVKGGEPTSVDDFEDELAFRDYVGKKAMEMYNSQSAELGQAERLTLGQCTTKLMYKFLKKGE